MQSILQHQIKKILKIHAGIYIRLFNHGCGDKLEPKLNFHSAAFGPTSSSSPVPPTSSEAPLAPENSSPATPSFSGSPPVGPEYVRFHIRVPQPGNVAVGDGSSITCAIAAPSSDPTFKMTINGVPFEDIEDGDTWGNREANFRKYEERHENGTVETVIAGFIDTFRQDHNMTEIRCFSESFEGNVSATLVLRPVDASKSHCDVRETYLIILVSSCR